LQATDRSRGASARNLTGLKGFIPIPPLSTLSWQSEKFQLYFRSKPSISDLVIFRLRS
jgi:hypothetical protein